MLCRYRFIQRDRALVEYFCRSRACYTERIKQCRRKGKFVIYTDETWVGCGMGHSQGQIVSQNYQNLFCENVPLLAPTLRGKRLVVLHCLTSDGLLDEAWKVIMQRTLCKSLTSSLSNPQALWKYRATLKTTAARRLLLKSLTRKTFRENVCCLS